MAALNPYVGGAPLSTFDTFHFLVKSVLGIGTFYVPVAFACTGFVGGFLYTTLFTFLYIYGIHLMLKCMIEARSRNKGEYLTMSETIAFAFGEGPKCCYSCAFIFGYLVDILLIIAHFSIGVIYIVFIAENLKSIANGLWDSLNIRIFIAIVALCLVPLFLIRDVNYLVPLNITGNILIFIVIGCFLVGRMSNSILPNPFEKHLISGDHAILKYNIHLYIGYVMFSLSSVGVMVTFESKMAKPDAYLGLWGTLNRATCFTLATNLIWGLISYFYLGDAMYLPFLENMQLEPYGDYAKFCVAVLVYLTYPLNGFIPIDIIFNQYILKFRELNNPECVEMIVRMIYLILTAICALLLPLIIPIVKLICAIALPLLNLIFPALAELCFGYYDDRKFIWMLWHILIIILGVLVLLCGLYSAYYDITIYYLGKPIKDSFWEKANDEIN